MERPHPPTPRREALARKAGVVLESPSWTAAIALGAAVAALSATVVTAAHLLIDRTRAQLANAAAPDAAARATAIDAGSLVRDVLSIGLPIAVAAAVGALVAGAALARGVFVPQREVRGAPSPPGGWIARVADGAIAAVRGGLLLAIAGGFVVAYAGATSRLAGARADAIAHGLAALAIAALAYLVAAAVGLAAIEVVVRHRRLAAALRMTDREARDDLRESSGDPTMRRRLRARDSRDPRASLASASVLVVGGAVAVALRRIAGTDRVEVVARARGTAATGLIAAARHRAVPAITDDALAEALADGRANDDVLAPRLAAVLAAVRA